MSRLENRLKNLVLTQSAKFFLPDTLKVTESTISTLKVTMGIPVRLGMEAPSPGTGY